MTSPAVPQRSTRRRVLRYALEAAAGLGVFAAMQRCQTHGLLETGTLAPDFEAQTLDGEAVHLSQYFGSRILLHFWATWCGVCKQEFGMLNRLADNLPEATRLLAVTTDEALPNLRRFATEQELRYPIILAQDDVVQRYRIRAFPTNYVIDSAGRVASSSVGMSTGCGTRARLGCAS
jgi:peroxiredoxin